MNPPRVKPVVGAAVVVVTVGPVVAEGRDILNPRPKVALVVTAGTVKSIF